MATYREIKGLTVPSISTDPPTASETSQAGQVWYNSTTGTLNTFVTTDTWSTTNSLNTARESLSGAGIATAGIVIAGVNLPATYYTKTEVYDGTSWSDTTDLTAPARRMGAAAGTQTSALYAGGYTAAGGTPTRFTDTTELFDGSTWTEVADLNNASYRPGVGTQTAALAISGAAVPGPFTNVESWNGASWTEIAVVNTARRRFAAAGTQTDALGFGGYNPWFANTESWNGVAWTEVSAMGTARYGNSGAGTTNSACVTAAGNPTPSSPAPATNCAFTEVWDGSTWTETTNMTTARNMVGGFGSLASAVVAGGSISTASALTEEFAHSILTYTPATWSSGGTMTTARNIYGGGAGDKSAGLGFSGYGPPPTTWSALSETYDGTAWSETADLNTARDRVMGAGSSTAALCAGGRVTTVQQTVTEEYNGASWTEVTGMPVGKAQGAVAGIQTAALTAGGGIAIPPANLVATTEEYNGSTWTAGGALNTERGGCTGAGTQTAGLCVGGNYSPDPTQYMSGVEEYNGTAWTAITANPQKIGWQGAAGIATDALLFGGESSTQPAGTATTSQFDGTSWYTTGDMPAIHNRCMGMGGTVGAALGGAGSAPGSGYLATTVEYSDTTSSATVSNIDFD